MWFWSVHSLLAFCLWNQVMLFTLIAICVGRETPTPYVSYVYRLLSIWDHQRLMNRYPVIPYYNRFQEIEFRYPKIPVLVIDKISKKEGIKPKLNFIGRINLKLEHRCSLNFYKNTETYENTNNEYIWALSINWFLLIFLYYS